MEKTEIKGKGWGGEKSKNTASQKAQSFPDRMKRPRNAETAQRRRAAGGDCERFEPSDCTVTSVLGWTRLLLRLVPCDGAAVTRFGLGDGWRLWLCVVCVGGATLCWVCGWLWRFGLRLSLRAPPICWVTEVLNLLAQLVAFDLQGTTQLLQPLYLHLQALQLLISKGFLQKTIRRTLYTFKNMTGGEKNTIMQRLMGIVCTGNHN